MTAEEAILRRGEINALIDTLPALDQSQYEVLMMAFDLQAELAALLTHEKLSASDVQEELKKVLEKRKAIDELISLNEVIKKTWSQLSSEEQGNFTVKGSGIRKVLRDKKTRSIDDTLKNKAATRDASDAGKNNSELPEGGSQKTQYNPVD